MATLDDAMRWIPKDEDVFLVIIKREDTSIPAEHWLDFVEDAEMGGAVWDTTLNSLEQDYEEIWKEDNVCDDCEHMTNECACSDEEEEEKEEK